MEYACVRSIRILISFTVRSPLIMPCVEASRKLRCMPNGSEFLDRQIATHAVGNRLHLEVGEEIARWW